MGYDSFYTLGIRIFFEFVVNHQISLAKQKENNGITQTSERTWDTFEEGYWYCADLIIFN